MVYMREIGASCPLGISPNFIVLLAHNWKLSLESVANFGPKKDK